MVSLISDNIFKYDLKILDLGCGKGAKSINIAKELKLKVKGIDALPEFIGEAVKYAQKHKVTHLCEFEVGDIRIEINNLKGYGIVILGAIGPVLGNLQQTLQSVRRCLNTEGYVLLDDGYLDDEYTGNYNRCLRKSEFYNHIDSAGFNIVKEIIMAKNQITDSDDYIFNSIEQRICELIKKFPENERVFLDYLESQKFENFMLENELTAGTWLLQSL